MTLQERFDRLDSSGKLLLASNISTIDLAPAFDRGILCQSLKSQKYAFLMHKFIYF